MTTPRDVKRAAEWQTAVRRGLVYSFLSRALAYPSAEQQAVLRERIAPGLIEFGVDREGPQGLRGALDQVGAPVDELRDAHTAVFTLTVSPDCPDYETAYDSGDVFQQTHTMADVGGFYRANGLEVGGQQSERPDHVGTELEFMSFLAFKEALALESKGPAELEVTREAQKLFLRDHLGCWAPSFGHRVEASAGADDSFYACVGRALSGWIVDDCESLAVVPARVVDQPTLECPEPDDGTCGVEDDCPLIGIDDIAMPTS